MLKDRLLADQANGNMNAFIQDVLRYVCIHGFLNGSALLDFVEEKFSGANREMARYTVLETAALNGQLIFPE